MNTEKFTGKAHAYAARPGYSDAAIDYLCSLVPDTTVFADIGAGTGKFTKAIARCGYKIFAVEPNDDMREQLSTTISPYPNASAIKGTAEATTLPDRSTNVITCAQALHWFDIDAFRDECQRIGKLGVMVVSIYNTIISGSNSSANSKRSAQAFFKNPILKRFPNPQFYTRDSWLKYMASHSHSPLPCDEGYKTHIGKVNAIFDAENKDGLLRRDVVTEIYWERLDPLV